MAWLCKHFSVSLIAAATWFSAADLSDSTQEGVPRHWDQAVAIFSQGQ
jgi:hypothetical protein